MPRMIPIALAWASLALASVASAQTYPTKPVRMIVPWPAGGVADVSARAIAEEMRASLGQPVVIENRPGASGRIGTEFVARSAADGYTILYTNPSNQTAPVVVDPKTSFDPVADFLPVILTGQAPYFLVVNARSPLRTVDDLVKLAAAKPGQLNYANPGVGSVSHFATVKFLLSAKIDVVPVTYKGEASAATDLLAGAVDMMFMTGAKPYVDDGRMRALGTTTPDPWFNLPDVPPISKAGLPGFSFVGWQGIVAPAKTPVAIRDALNRAANAALASPRAQAALREAGIKPLGGSPDLLATAIKDDMVTFRKVVADAHLTFEQ